MGNHRKRLQRKEIAFPGIAQKQVKKMAKNKKPTKRYTPKPVRPPITRGVFDDLGREMHFALMAFEHGGVTVEGWKRIAKVLMTVSLATDGEQRLDKADKVAVDSAVLTVKALSDKEVRTGQWNATDLDLIALQRGVTAAERMIPLLDYRKLATGYSKLRQLVAMVR